MPGAVLRSGGASSESSLEILRSNVMSPKGGSGKGDPTTKSLKYIYIYIYIYIYLSHLKVLFFPDPPFWIPLCGTVRESWHAWQSTVKTKETRMDSEVLRDETEV